MNSKERIQFVCPSGGGVEELLVLTPNWKVSLVASSSSDIRNDSVALRAF